MSGARFVVERLPEPGAAVRLSPEAAAHARARRLGAGSAVVLVDGTGREAHGVVSSAARGRIEVRVDAIREAHGDALAPIHLLAAVVKPDRLAWIAEKATELGASTLTLVVSERTQAVRAAGAPATRLERVIAEAAKQSERASWPRVHGPVALARALGEAPAGHRFLLDPRGEAFPPALAPAPVSLLIGPEGGWSDAETADALAAGWRAASLAAGKLRAETAAVAALTLARAALARGAH